MKRTKIGCSLHLIPLPSLPLPLCQYVSKLIVSTYNMYLVSMVYCIQCFYPQYLYIFLSFDLSTVFIYLLCLSVYRSFSLYSTVYPCKVSIFQQCLSMESTAPIYLQCIAVCSPCLSTVPIFFTVPNYRTVFDYGA